MKKKVKKLKPKNASGFRDLEGNLLLMKERMIEDIKYCFKLYGFDPLETPALELSANLGKFLPDEDRPQSGVFGFKDENEWLSLRYDLTAPLSRYFSQNFRELPSIFKRYQIGQVWRNERGGPGRFREFTQIDCDIIGSRSALADSELIILLAQILTRLFDLSKFIIKVSNRKLIQGLLEDLKISSETQKLKVIRSIDKYDRLGPLGVSSLLKKGRRDPSGDFTSGANLSDEQVAKIIGYKDTKGFLQYKNIVELEELSNNFTFKEGINELKEIFEITNKSKFLDKIIFSAEIVRGIEYYSGNIFEASITDQIKNKKGEPIISGAIAAGGRWDGLINRFINNNYPASGLSIGIDRIVAYINDTANLVFGEKFDSGSAIKGPIIIATLDKNLKNTYLEVLNKLRESNIRSEIYLGNKDLQNQMIYANRRNSPAVILIGNDENISNKITIKDMKKEKQFKIDKNNLINEIRKIVPKDI